MAARLALAIQALCRQEQAAAINKGDLVSTSVLSGNRNFEGRVNPDVKANYLASPPLVVAYAIVGSMTVNITKDPLGTDKKGNPVYLKDIWPIQSGNRRDCAQERLTQNVPRALPRRIQRRYALAQN